MWVTDSECVCKYEKHSRTCPPQKAHPANESRTIHVSDEQWALHIWVKIYTYESRSIYTHVQVWVRNYMYESRTVVMSHELYIWVSIYESRTVYMSHVIDIYLYIHIWIVTHIYRFPAFTVRDPHMSIYTYKSRTTYMSHDLYIHPIYIYSYIGHDQLMRVRMWEAKSYSSATKTTPSTRVTNMWVMTHRLK